MLLILKTKHSDQDKINVIDNLNKQSDNSLLQIINTQTRKTDFILRNNGDFTLILVETPIEGTRILKDRLHQEISRVCTSNESQNTISTSNLKIDYFTFPEQSDSIKTWIFNNKDEHDQHTTNQSKL